MLHMGFWSLRGECEFLFRRRRCIVEEGAEVKYVLQILCLFKHEGLSEFMSVFVCWQFLLWLLWFIFCILLFLRG